MGRISFKHRFCERFGCQDSEYEERAFRKCLYPHARCIAPLLRWFNPSFFEQDFKLLRYLGETTGRREASIEMLRFQDWNKDGGSFRTTMRIRVSGRKASLLTGELFGHEADGGRATVLQR